MGSTINSRIEELISVLKMSNNAFAKSLGKTSTTINQIVAGRNNPSFDVLDAICSIHNVSPSWLLKGEGSIFADPVISASNITAPDQYLQDHVKHLEESFSKLAQQLEVKDRQIENKDQQIEGLQNTVNVLLGKYRPAPVKSKVRRLWDTVPYKAIA